MKAIHNFNSQLAASVVLLCGSLCAQAPAQPTNAEPVSYTSLNQVNQLLSQLEQASTAAQADLAKLRVEKWKTNSDSKHQTQSNVESLNRNLHDAMPEMIAGLRAAPESLAATFKIYRNLDAVYDVFGSVVEAAGAFGPNDDFQALGNDLNALERSRHSFAERMEGLTTAKENEIVAMRGQLKNLQAAIPAPAATKTVVDDTQPVAKPKKKRVKAPATPAVAPTAPPAH